MFYQADHYRYKKKKKNAFDSLFVHGSSFVLMVFGRKVTSLIMHFYFSNWIINWIYIITSL